MKQGIFPLTLDPFGRISSEDSGAGSGTRITAQTLLEAERKIASQTMPPGSAATLAGFVAALHQAGTLMTAQMPVDLFAPDGHERARMRQHSAADGRCRAESISRFDAERDQGPG